MLGLMVAWRCGQGSLSRGSMKGGAKSEFGAVEGSELDVDFGDGGFVIVGFCFFATPKKDVALDGGKFCTEDTGAFEFFLDFLFGETVINEFVDVVDFGDKEGFRWESKGFGGESLFVSFEFILFCINKGNAIGVANSSYLCELGI